MSGWMSQILLFLSPARVSRIKIFKIEIDISYSRTSRAL